MIHKHHDDWCWNHNYLSLPFQNKVIQARIRIKRATAHIQLVVFFHAGNVTELLCLQWPTVRGSECMCLLYMQLTSSG